MNCPQVEPHLSVYADGELRGAERGMVESHLATCEACRGVVERWQALRRCAQRAIVSQPLPVGLQSRIATTLRSAEKARRIRRWRFAGSLAAAAVILFAVTLRPTSVGATTLPAAHFAKVYRHCALKTPHDQIGCRHGCPRTTSQQLARQMHFEVLVPDLSGCGYVLEGVCLCGSLPDLDLRFVHAFYHGTDHDKPVVSVFSINGRVRLLHSKPLEQPLGRGAQHYQVAADREVTVLKWDRHEHSYALCGQMNKNQLSDLASGLEQVTLVPVRIAYGPSMSLRP